MVVDRGWMLITIIDFTIAGFCAGSGFLFGTALAAALGIYSALRSVEP